MSTGKPSDRFTPVVPTEGQTQAMSDMRVAFWSIAEIIQDLCPLSDERTLALVKLKEASMWANETIARYGVSP